MLPAHDRLALAARYLPASPGTRAGDWYDVLPLDDGRVAIAVGDVVGRGARAGAVMGRLRNSLACSLLEGLDPARALENLDRFADRAVPGATGSTVACLVLDVERGELEWASAGHLPPLVVGPSAARFLEGARGPVLGLRSRSPFCAGRSRLDPGESVVLYTDGLVERRGEVIDDGLDRLARAGAGAHDRHPGDLADAVLSAALGAEPMEQPTHDDIALIVARLVPAPLRIDLPSDARRLRGMRCRLAEWGRAAGLTPDRLDDLQLAVGEAAANSIEHGYRDRPGRVQVDVARLRDGRVRVVVRDQGDWRPAPTDRGCRGRGLDMIRELGDQVAVHHGGDGTEVSFEIAEPVPEAVR